MRDPNIFAFIHRYLCGYPVHLPSTEWETLCLLHDVRHVYKLPAYEAQLYALLEDSNEELGKKVRLIKYLQTQGENPNLESNWQELIDLALTPLMPELSKGLRMVGFLLKLGKTDLGIFSPLIKAFGTDDSLFQSVLGKLVREYGIEVIVDLHRLLQNISKDTSSRPPSCHSKSSESTSSDEAVDEPSPQKSPRFIPPPKNTIFDSPLFEQK